MKLEKQGGKREGKTQCFPTQALDSSMLRGASLRALGGSSWCGAASEFALAFWLTQFPALET